MMEMILEIWMAPFTYSPHKEKTIPPVKSQKLARNIKI